MTSSGTQRESRLQELKQRLDAIHDTVLQALRAQDEAVLDRAMEEQHKVMKEYQALLKTPATR